MSLCRFERVSETTIRCQLCGVERQHAGDPALYRRNCPASALADTADANVPSRGLGDTIAKLTHATGIAQAVEAVSQATGLPCGCKQRQEWLNKVLPYGTGDASPKKIERAT